MKTIKVISKSLLSLILGCGLLTQSCTDKFEEFNTKPYTISEEMMEYDNFGVGSFFPQLQQYVIPNPSDKDAFVYQRTQNLFGDSYSGYIGTIGKWHSGVNSTTYNFDSDWINDNFLAFVEIITAWRGVKKQTIDQDGKNPEVYALAQIIKVAGLHRLTDMYGPMPYSQIDSVELVPYDSQEAIYKSFFKELDSAIDVLTDLAIADPSARFNADYDLVYQGDYTKWVKFANSLKLRLALRISKVAPEDAQKYAEAAVAHQIGVITSNGDNAQLPVENNPLERITNGYDEIRMGASIESILKGYNDPRMSKYFKPGKNGDEEGYFGVRSGIQITNQAKYASASRLNFEMNSPLMWLNAAEVSFLRAEGDILGWNMNGTAEEFYNQGIKHSFDQWGAGGYEAYVKNNVATPVEFKTSLAGGHNMPSGIKVTVKWDDAKAKTEKVEKILTQKWLALYPNGQEGWSNYRRTGFPQLFPVVNNNSGGKVDTKEQVKRIPFPHAEYQTNGKNVEAAVVLLGGPDTGGTNLWWDVD